jgi:3-deoxy-D-manno-octulosonic-acid transferase
MKIALGLYNFAWRLAIPALRWNHRLAQGFEQRILLKPPAMRADLWIQAASVGEAFLARGLLKKLIPDRHIQVLLTSNTTQGMDILEQTAAGINSFEDKMSAHAAYFPFDKPAIMGTAVSRIRPKVMVILETELWPGHLVALKRHGCQTIIINGRLTQKSLNRYRIWASLWQSLEPDRILAISEGDARRFKRLFGSECVQIMPNIKFDHINAADDVDMESPTISDWLPPDSPFITLGSIRRQEEKLVANIIQQVVRSHNTTVIGLFPRHMHRISAWRKILRRLGIGWFMRSTVKSRIPHGSVVLWDTVGELQSAYKFSTAAFVGGSLAPLGGQNFLEPLVCGVIPVIGPSWENFAWVGKEIVTSGLLDIAADWKDAAQRLIQYIENPTPRRQIIKRARAYIEDRQGGTELACRQIVEMLEA